MLFLGGGNADLGPEEANTWSVGFDFEPTFARWARFSVSYFDVEYDGRIDTPAFGADQALILAREERFPGLLIRTPSAAQVADFLAADQDGVTNFTATPFDPATQDVLTVFPDLVLFDNRTGNVAVETFRGIDVSVRGDASWGASEFTFGLNATYTFEHERSVTATSPSFSRLNEVGKPVDFRLRADAGWSTGPLSAFVAMNYVDSYANPFVVPEGEIESWTTLDLSLRFDSSGIVDAPPDHSFTASFNVSNLFDEPPPPFLNTIRGANYDPTNASPVGRYISVRLSKTF